MVSSTINNDADQPVPARRGPAGSSQLVWEPPVKASKSMLDTGREKYFLLTLGYDGYTGSEWGQNYGHQESRQSDSYTQRDTKAQRHGLCLSSKIISKP